MINTFSIDRTHRGRKLRLRAAYNEATGDWDMVLFEGKKIIDTRATVNVYATARAMFELTLDNPPPGVGY